MKQCVWYKVYKYLVNKYFIRNRMIVKLYYVSEYVVVYQIVRNNKIVLTKLKDFVRDFSIINY